ncbi:LPXTG-site transpeptidase (sortase) family protein [Actinoplanes tereljensis]|uniref:Sortase n=1 Tax=Paractinoplanes tereljensis TaxID=571912 RepID=A0A919NXF2_9ACTN|nr:sortase [Actinoplanes tereljensis]GIF25137.1 sortase [Actinoplanes tereljensis]
MTATITEPLPAPVEEKPAPRPRTPPPPPRPRFTGGSTVGTALTILAALALGFVAQMTVLGSLSHERAQRVAYANFRAELAQATAPVSHFDEAGTDALAEGSAVAIISIPAIGVQEVVFEGTDGGVLSRGPGHRRDTVFPGQKGVSVLMARRAAFGGPFARIGDLRVGDKITVINGQGEHAYQVMGVRRSGEPQPPALAAGEGRLTLVTADGQAYAPTDVLRADAKLVTPAQDTPRLAIGSAILPTKDAVMGIDLMALIPLVLWGQLLVAAALSVAWTRHRLGPWHAWLIGVPVLGLLGVLVAGQITQLLPNLI